MTFSLHLALKPSAFYYLKVFCLQNLSYFSNSTSWSWKKENNSTYQCNCDLILLINCTALKGALSHCNSCEFSSPNRQNSEAVACNYSVSHKEFNTSLLQYTRSGAQKYVLEKEFSTLLS